MADSSDLRSGGEVGRGETTPPRQYLRFPPSGCFGCSETNSAGLGLRFYREGDRILSDHVVTARFDGASGVVHGGIQAVMLDEAMCAAVTLLHGTRVVTGEITIRYRRACRSERPLRIVARVVSRHERYAAVAGEIQDDAGTVLTTAKGRFFYNVAPS